MKAINNVMKGGSGIVAGILFLASMAAANAGDFEEPVTLSPAAEDRDWNFNFGLNLWGPEISATTAGGATVDLGLDDILSDLNMTVMASFVAEKGRWFIGTDLLYLDLQSAVYGKVGPLDVKTDVDLSSWILTPAAGYRVCEGAWGNFDIFAGARYLYMDVDSRVVVARPIAGNTVTAISDSGSEWAGIVGFKGRYNLSEKWYLPVYFDIGTGQPDLTIQAFAGVGYRASLCDISLGYRYLKWDMDMGSPLSELEIKGPMLGFHFSF